MFRALLALVLLPSLALAQAEEKLEIRNLGQCGLVTRYASPQIGDTCLQEAENVYLDEDAGITRRKGFAKFNTTAITDTKSVRGIWPFRATDGTEYIVALSSETMFQSDGDGSFSAISPAIAGKSSTQDMDCQQCLGKLWCVNGSDSMFFWDATSTGTVSGAPTCSAIDCFRNRIALSNCSGTLSQLRMSGELDGTDWTISASPVSTSPVAISIGGVNDGKKVQCIQGVYQDVLVLGKEDSTWGLYGFDRRDFAVREISREVGCIENRSGREKQGSLYWLSKRGVEKMTGPSITRVSDSIRDLVDTIIVAGGNSRSTTDSSQTDFEAGNLTASGPGAPLSASIVTNSVVPSTHVHTEESHADVVQWSTGTGVAMYLGGASVGARDNEWRPDASAGTNGQIFSPGFDNVFSTAVFSCSYHIRKYLGSGNPTISSMSVQFSSAINGPWSNSILCASTTTASSESVEITGSAQSGSNGGRYARIQMDVNPNGGATSMISSFTLTSATTGYFISQCRNPGTAITGWGLFQCNRALNSGDMSFAISVGTTCHGVTRATATWTAQANNSVITVATAAYVAYRTLFDIDSATETPTLNDCTINWNEGASRPSVAAEIYRDRYYLAYTSGTSGTVINDRLLVLDSRDQWILHDQPNCTSLGIYNRKLYCGDSGATGRVYQMDIGQDDDGASFTSNFRTKDFDFGNTWQKKQINRMYFDLAGLPSQDYSISLTPSYTLDASTDVVTLNPINLNEDYSRFIAAKVPADLSNNTSARWYNFGLTNTGSQGPWRVYGIKIVFSRLSED